MNDVACPACGSNPSIPIMYGLPDEETLRRAQRGEVALGGCTMSPDMDDFQCVTCGQRYRADGSTQNPIDESIVTKAREAKTKRGGSLLLFGRDVSPAVIAKAINAERDRQAALKKAGVDPGPRNGYRAWKTRMKRDE